MIRTLIVAAGLAAAGSANAAFVGGGLVVDNAASAAASATLGSPTTVVSLLISFSEADDILNSIGNANFSTNNGELLVNNGLFGANPNFDGAVNDAAFGAFPETEWDTYVGIGGPFFNGVSTATGDTDFGFTPTGVVGGWFDVPGDDGMGGVTRQGLAGDGTFDGTNWLVWAGQFVVEGDFTGARGTDGLAEGLILSEIFSGQLDINWIDSLGGPNNAASAVQVGIPAPGAAALFGLAGLTASRRRRG